MEKEKTNKEIVQSIRRVFGKYRLSSLAGRMLVLDLALLDLTQEKALAYYEQHKIYPGYSRFFSMLALPNYGVNRDLKPVSPEHVAFLNDSLDCILEKELKRTQNQAVVSAMSLAQRDWQQPYIFKTYLFNLFLKDAEIQDFFKKIVSISEDDMVSACLLPKIASHKEFLMCFLREGVRPHVFFDNFLKFVINNMPYVSIEMDDYRKRQMEKLKEKDYNPFYTRPIAKDYPVIRTVDGSYIFSSYFYLQDAFISRTLREIAKQNGGTKAIGNALEDVTYDSFQKMYSHCDADDSSTKAIMKNPLTKKSGELCDVFIKNNNKYLLIDCKAKEIIEDIFYDNSDELDRLEEVVRQRIQRVKAVEEGKFVKYFPNGISREDLYSIIVLMDDGTYSKEDLFNNRFGDLSDGDKDYFEKHIHILSYGDLLESVAADVDFIQVIEESIANGNYNNHLKLNIKSEHKKDYHKLFDEWYNNAVEKLKEFFVSNSLLDEAKV